MEINNPIVTDSEWLQAAAVSIQNKDGGSKMGVPDFASRIDALPTGGGTLIPKTINENGVYNASSDNADGYDVVTVGVNEINDYLTKTIKRFNLPDVTSIPNYQFTDQLNLEYISMPNIITLGRQAFRFCTKLSLDELPIGLTTIGSNAFERCPLTITKLPSNVSYIGSQAFRSCMTIPYLDLSNLVSIPTLEAQAFDATTVPFYFRDQQQLDEIAATTNWSVYADRFQIKPSGVI